MLLLQTGYHSKNFNNFRFGPEQNSSGKIEL